MIILPGGFSGGDEPDGLRQVHCLLLPQPERSRTPCTTCSSNRDGLMLGICNGFQALIKLGLVPYGEIRDLDDSCPTLTFNADRPPPEPAMCTTRVASVN